MECATKKNAHHGEQLSCYLTRVRMLSILCPASQKGSVLARDCHVFGGEVQAAEGRGSIIFWTLSDDSVQLLHLHKVFPSS